LAIIGIFKTAEQAARNYKDAEKKELDLLNEFEASIVAGKIAKVEEGVQYVGDGIGNLIPVPVGFSYLEGNKNNGFVIKNDTDNNEFVWVPTEGLGYTYNRYSFSEVQPEFGIDEETNSMKIQTLNNTYYYFTEAIPTDESASVQKYGGYYIGRYESGKENGELVIQSQKTVWGGINVNDAIEVAGGLYQKSTDNVVSKLCSSYVWDTALKFIETQNKTYPINSIGGYYSKVSPTKTGYDTIHPCNIYDMGGNVWEWTTETFSMADVPFVLRGGCFDQTGSYKNAFMRIYQTDTYDGGNVGFRVALFL